MFEDLETPAGHVRVTGPLTPAQAPLLTPEALSFLATLARRFTEPIEARLAARRARQARFDAGERPDFLPETRAVREGDWTCDPLPPALLDRRVEITGPVDAKMILNALNSGARVFMADFEDATAPRWDALIEGQRNLREAVAGTLRYEDPKSGKRYTLGPEPALLMVRPRGLHLPEPHVEVDGRPMPGALFDFGLFAFHNARALAARGQGPFFYLPKLESHLEARLWAEVFDLTEATLGLPPGAIKATVLIETLPAAFEMHEILFELRRHAAGLNCGRWDYIFSFIKARRADPAAVLPDRGAVTMTQRCMASYARLLIRTCHRRGVHAMGGMAAQIPDRRRPEADAAARALVAADKHREQAEGHDGTWVAHPGLVSLAYEAFDTPNQLHRLREDVEVTREDLLAVPEGPRTEAGLRLNLRVGVQYLAAWLGGRGAVALYGKMEDAATAEISRAQVSQWLAHGVTLDDGQPVTPERVEALLAEEVSALWPACSAEQARLLERAVELWLELLRARPMPDFFTLTAYPHLETETPA